MDLRTGNPEQLTSSIMYFTIGNFRIVPYISSTATELNTPPYAYKVHL